MLRAANHQAIRRCGATGSNSLPAKLLAFSSLPASLLGGALHKPLGICAGLLRFSSSSVGTCDNFSGRSATAASHDAQDGSGADNFPDAALPATPKRTPPLPLKVSAGDVASRGVRPRPAAGARLDQPTRSLIAALAAAAVLLGATLFWAKKEAEAEGISVGDVLWRLFAPASAARRPAVSLSAPAAGGASTDAAAAAAAAREAARLEYDVEQQLRAALPSRAEAIEAAIAFNRKHPRRGASAASAASAAAGSGDGDAGRETKAGGGGLEPANADPLSDELLGFEGGSPAPEPAASSSSRAGSADADSSSSSASDMPALTMLPTVVLSLEGLLLDRAWHPKGHVTALRPRVAEGLLALADTGCEIVLWSRQRDADSARALFEAHVLPAIMAVDAYRYMAFERHMRQTARQQYFQLYGSYEGADAYADTVLHSPMSPHSVGRAYVSACLHITAVLGREAILPRGVAAPGTTTVAAAGTEARPVDETQAPSEAADSIGSAAGDGELLDKSLLRELQAEQVAALRYLGIAPRKGKGKGKGKASGKATVDAQASIGPSAPAAAESHSVSGAAASAAAAVPVQSATAPTAASAAALPAGRLQLGVKRLDLLPRPRSDVLLVDCNPATAAVFPGNTLLLPPLEVVRDSSDGSHGGSGDVGSVADDDNGLLGRGIAAAARFFGSDDASSAAKGHGSWLDVEASPEAGVRRMSLALAQPPPDVPTTLVVSADAAAASAAAAAEAAKRIAIATGRATDDGDSSDSASSSAASSSAASGASASPLDRERGDIELLADMISLYRTAAAARLLTLRRAREQQQQRHGSDGDALSAPGVSRVLAHAGSIESWLSYIKSRGIAVDYRFADGHGANEAGRRDAYDPYLRSHAALVAVLRMKEAASGPAAT